MMFRADLHVPFGYGRQLVTLGWLRTWLLEHHHPEFVDRLVAWLDSQDGRVGVGGGWRAGGAQPNKPGFAPEGKSFHQDQNFDDGFCGAAAVDLVVRNGDNVHRAPTWGEVLAQGTVEAARWGVHCNVGVPGQVGSEPWHMQPVELDGWQTWWNQGRPSPVPGYPFPGRYQPTPDDPEPTPTPTPEPILKEDDMTFIQRDPQGRFRIGNDIHQTMYEADDGEVVMWVIRRRQRAGRPLLTQDPKTLDVTEVTELEHIKPYSDKAIRSLGRGGAG